MTSPLEAELRAHVARLEVSIVGLKDRIKILEGRNDFDDAMYGRMRRAEDEWGKCRERVALLEARVTELLIDRDKADAP